MLEDMQTGDANHLPKCNARCTSVMYVSFRRPRRNSNLQIGAAVAAVSFSAGQFVLAGSCAPPPRTVAATLIASTIRILVELPIGSIRPRSSAPVHCIIVLGKN